MRGVFVPEWLGVTLLPVWLIILWLAVAYLFLLGTAVLITAARARKFLSGFAQDKLVNNIEAGVRALVGLAFVGAAKETKNALLAVVVGMFLIVSALLLALLPKLHRRFAPQATAVVFRVFPLFGVLAIALAVILGWFIA